VRRVTFFGRWRRRGDLRDVRDRADTGDEIYAIPGEDMRESTCNVNGRKNKLWKGAGN